MPRRKVRHCGDGPLVRDSSGWQIAPGDTAKYLPRAADATILNAIKSGRLVYEDTTATATQSVEDETPEVPETDDADNDTADIATSRLTLIQCARTIMDMGSDEILTASGKPTVEALRELFIDSDGDTELEITAALRDDVSDEALKIADTDN